MDRHITNVKVGDILTMVFNKKNSRIINPNYAFYDRERRKYDIIEKKYIVLRVYPYFVIARPVDVFSNWQNTSFSFNDLVISGYEPSDLYGRDKEPWNLKINS